MQTKSLGKKDFQHNIIHELLTPLHHIIGFSNLGKKKKLSADKIHDYFKTIHKSGQKLQRVIENHLELNVNTPYEFEQQNLQELITKSIATWIKKDSRFKRVEVQSIMPAVASIFKPKFEKALFEILHNSITYSKNKVYVSIEQLFHNIHIEIKDSGKGIPKIERIDVFKPYFQASNNDGATGSGIGLTVARRIIQKHSGKIWITKCQNKGTTVNIQLGRNDEK